VHLDIPSKCLSDVPTDGQAKSHSVLIHVSIFFDLCEGSEELGLLLLRHPNSCVLNVNPNETLYLITFGNYLDMTL
jgi:hypothetical protein